MSAKPPILMRGGLSGRIYIVTRYTERFAADGTFLGYVASIKYDVTEQFESIERERSAEAGEVGP